MKHICCFFIFLCALGSLNASTKASEDSLLHIVKTTKDLRQKYMAEINLSDLHFEEPAQQSY